MRVLPLSLILMIATVMFASPVAADHQWDQVLDSAARFTVLEDFGGKAVLDRETGLVWQRQPHGTPLTWLDAHAFCNQLGTTQNTVFPRSGWRLPAIQELASLIDHSTADKVHPALPPGHPFQNVQPTHYWSANSAFTRPPPQQSNASPDIGVEIQLLVWGAQAWAVDFQDGDTDLSGKNNQDLTWCVRGGQGVNPQ